MALRSVQLLHRNWLTVRGVDLFQFSLYLLAPSIPYYDDYVCVEDYCERYGHYEHCINDRGEMFPFAGVTGIDDGDCGCDVAAAAAAVDEIAGSEIDCCRWANGGTVCVVRSLGRFESYDFWMLCLMTMEMLMWIRIGHEMATDVDCGSRIDDDGCCCCC